MIWPFLPLLAAYGVIAWLFTQLGLAIVGESQAGQRATPIVAALWPLAIAFLVIVGIVALIDVAFDRSTAWMRRSEP